MFVFRVCLCTLCVQSLLTFSYDLCINKAMPHGSEKSPEKNRNEIRHSLCMPHGSAKSWQIMKKMTHKNVNIVEKTSSSV